LLELFADATEIVSADSMQVYRGMDIGTAKPTPAILSRIPHYLIDIRNPDEGFSAGDFVREADALTSAIHSRGCRAVISGGTAFYLRSFIYGLPETPQVAPQIRVDLEREWIQRGPDALRSELEQVDPSSARRLPPGDRYRIIRALEVYRSEGRPLSSYALPAAPRDGFRFRTIGFERDRSELYARIERRVDEMFDAGLEDEVEGLLALGYGFDAPGMKAIGYHEFEAYRKGEYTVQRTRELIKRNSRRYAKRQITFFKQLPGVSWFSPDDIDGIRSAIEGFARQSSGSSKGPDS
jgi:tRNA dimethylallyltransferase